MIPSPVTLAKFLSLTALLALGTIIPSRAQDSPAGFVSVKDGHFSLADKPYYFVGVNFWQGMNLGIEGGTGNRTQLVAELDRLQELGITNLRVMASSEGPDTEPYRMTPALMTAPGEYNADVLDGLDYFMSEVGKHGMKAVMVLSNFWQWSGGFGQYVSWHDKTAIPYPGDWNVFMNYVASFYTCDECQTWYRDHISMIVNHVNPYTGLAYRDDPAVFSWELANEPRLYPDEWIDQTAAYIKSLDSNHMVTTGSEGSLPDNSQDFIKTHNSANIDYATIHIWPQNWGWYDPQKPQSYSVGESRARSYLQTHIALAASLGKPLVLEEFGLARDWEPLHDTFDPASPTTYRDQFYSALFTDVNKAMSTGQPVGGDNFWAWGGAARPGAGWVGDPPHETPGWYSVYDTDGSTLTIITDHVQMVADLQK